MLLPLLGSCHRQPSVVIAVIPRTSGVLMWEPEHGGALATALPQGADIYWNAPTREDDIQGQIALVDRVASRSYQGLVLSPDHALALITPVRRAIARGLPTVVLGSPLAMPAGNGLWYVLNDEQTGARMAAQRLTAMLGGKGSIAVLGINPDITGIVERARLFEGDLAQSAPEIRVVVNRSGSFNLPHEQQVAEETLREHPEIDVIVTMTATAMHSALAAIAASPEKHIRVIAFDPDSLTFDSPNLDSMIFENTRRMGTEAVQLLLAEHRGISQPAVTYVEPVLVTRENIHTDEVTQLTSMDWRPARMRWKWSVGP
ncbi:substrate-binding domain-containing protein [Silvibacterium dinghuense]|nr:substrate-binding domain-containing protein [Silvibacterium dinghuense]GGH11392.1 hypothetical protein GCM10011586_30050 [Silvibacterium dinghuense]